MEPKVFDVLLHLLRHRERVLSKDELLDALWPGEAVSESVLPRCVAAARRAVGDDRARQAVLRTAHGRGYRFVAELSERGAAVAPHAAPQPLAPASAEAQLFGRETLLERLRDALASAAAGRGRAVFVVGEPGIGKTRSVEELERDALRLGFRWVSGRCLEDASAPAYRPWVQVLRALADDAAPETLGELLGSGEAELAGLVPELRGRLPNVASGPELHDQAARYRLFDAVEGFLRRSAGQQPLVVFVDDLHWADADSLQLVEFLMPALRRTPILFVGAYRDVAVRRSHPLAGVLAALAREEHCSREPLVGLAPPDVAALIKAATGEAASDEVASAISELTGGNPFFVQEMAQLLAEEGRLDSRDLRLSWTLPQGVRDAVGRRLDSLSDECNELLRAAAVLGDEFQLAHLAALVGESGEALLELVAEALAAHLLDEAPGIGVLCFRHALIRRTLQQELGVARRIALHRRAAETLEAAHGSRAGEHAAELAHHWFECAPAGDPQPAIAWSQRAAQQAAERRAYEESARHIERALEALALRVPVPEARQLELLLQLGAMRSANGERTRARDAFCRAADLARALERPEWLGDAAIGFAGLAEMGAPPDPEKQALLEEALVVLGDDHPARRASVLARLSGMATMASTRAERQAMSSEALRLARRAGDDEALANALAARSWAFLGADGLDDRLAVSAEIEELAARRGDLRGLILACEGRLGVSLLRGEMQAAQREADLFRVHADALRQPALQFLALLSRGTVAMSCGDFGAAERWLEQAAAIGDDVLPYSGFLSQALQAWLSGMRGDRSGFFTVGGALGEQAATIYPALGRIVQAGLATADLLRGDRESGARRYAELMDTDVEAWERDEHWLFNLGMCAELAIGLDDVEGAARLRDLLQPYAELMVCHDQMRTVVRSVASVLGDLAACCGDAEAAQRHYEAALESEVRAGLRPCLILTRAAYARLLSRGDDTARKRGAALRAEAERLAVEIGSERLQWEPE